MNTLEMSNKYEMIDNIMAKVNYTNLLDEYINYTLLVIICIFFYSKHYI